LVLSAHPAPEPIILGISSYEEKRRLHTVPSRKGVKRRWITLSSNLSAILEIYYSSSANLSVNTIKYAYVGQTKAQAEYQEFRA
jgi:hypothetical protein